MLTNTPYWFYKYPIVAKKIKAFTEIKIILKTFKIGIDIFID